MLKSKKLKWIFEPFERPVFAAVGLCVVLTFFGLMAFFGWNVSSFQIVQLHKPFWAIIPIVFAAIIYTFGAFCALVLTYTSIIRPTIRRRPVVRVWSWNKIFAICAEADYQLWQEQHERAIRAGIESEGLRPAPRCTAFFTNDSDETIRLGDLQTGTLRDVDVLVENCRVERSELFIPTHEIDNGNFVPVSLEQAWRLIHNAEPPEGTFSE